MIFKNIKMQFAWLITFYLAFFKISVFAFLYDNAMGSVIASLHDQLIHYHFLHS